MWVPPFMFIRPQAPLLVGGQGYGLAGTPPEVGAARQQSSTGGLDSTQPLACLSSRGGVPA